MSKAILLYFLLSLSLVCVAQDTIPDMQKNLIYDTERLEGTHIDKEAIDNFKNDPDYNYLEIEPEETWLTRLRRKLSEIWNSFIRSLTGGAEATGVLASLLALLPYVMIGALLGVLIWVFLKIDNARAIVQTHSKGVYIGDDEEILKNEDILSLIDPALQDKNYRLAVRYYYLLTLQKLSGKELIDWQVQKTNHEYIYEIKNNNLRKQFGQLTDVYDYIWYGNFEVDEPAFAKAQLAFNKINSEI